jgi:hypothetical protein
VVDADLDDIKDRVNPNAPVSSKLASYARSIAKDVGNVSNGIFHSAPEYDVRPIHGKSVPRVF